MSQDKITEEVVEVVQSEADEPVIVETSEKTSGVTKLVHPDGRVAHAHESMIHAYKSGGFREE